MLVVVTLYVSNNKKKKEYQWDSQNCIQEDQN